MRTKTIVISAVNLVEGGTFTILHDCLFAITGSHLAKQYHILAIVHSRKGLPSTGVDYIELPKAKRHYIYRLYYEYIKFKRISQKYDVDLWFSLHDMSPRVKAKSQAVYMHNPTPFYKPKWRDWKYVPINAVWAYLYKYLYGINIHANRYLVVQQNWLRDEFSRMFSFPADRIIVARPSCAQYNNTDIEQKVKGGETVFLYPALPRVFKNFDVICEAARILEDKGVKDVRIILTVSGSENGYARYLVNRYRDSKLIEFSGLIPKENMRFAYNKTDCLLFPSKLETWGLPLSEFQAYNRPMIVADLPYAQESAAGAESVRFFNPDNAEELVESMIAVINGDLSTFVTAPQINTSAPFSSSWVELFTLMLKEKS